ELGGELKRLKEELEFAARLKGQAGGTKDILTLTVGVAVDSAEQTTFDTRQAVEPKTLSKSRAPEPSLARGPVRARIAGLRRWLRQHSKAMMVVALVVATSAAALAWRQFTAHSNAIDSIAVLPFANVGNDPQMAYLADGI